MFKKMCTIIALALFASGTLNAQGLGLGPMVGLHKADNSDSGEFLGGIALRAKLSKSLGIEGSILYRQQQYDDGQLTTKSWPIMVTGLFYPIPIVYAAAGFGWHNSTIEYDYNTPLVDFSASETKQKVGWHFGGGVEVPLGKSMKLTGDIRYTFLDYNFEKVPGDDDLKSDFFMFTAGIMFGL